MNHEDNEGRLGKKIPELDAGPIEVGHILRWISGEPGRDQEYSRDRHDDPDSRVMQRPEITFLQEMEESGLYASSKKSEIQEVN